MNIKNSEHLYRNVLALLLMFASACGGSANKSSLHASHQAAAADETSDLPLCPVGCAPIITGPSEGSFHPVSPGGDIGTEPITPARAATEPAPAPPVHEGSGGSGLAPLPPLPALPAPEPAPTDAGSSSAPKAAPDTASLPNFTPNFPPVPQSPDFKLPNQPDPSTTGAGNSSTGATLASLYAAYFGTQVAKLDADVVAANASAAAALASGRESRAKHQPKAPGKISAGAHPVSSSLRPEDAARLTEAWMYRDKVAAAIEPTDPRAQDRQDLVKAADSGLSQADDAFTKGERAVGEFSYRFAVMALDMAISVSPAGWAKFGMEAVTGRDMLTHEPLSTFSRGVAIAVTAGTLAGLVATSELSIPALVAIDVMGSMLKTLGKEEAVLSSVKVARDVSKSLFASRFGEAFFWSGRLNGTSVSNAARDLAQAQGGVTLEKLMEMRGITLADYNPAIPETVAAWTKASLEYAQSASGEVTALLGDMRPGSIWLNQELPALLKNPDVSLIKTVNAATGEVTVVFKK